MEELGIIYPVKERAEKGQIKTSYQINYVNKQTPSWPGISTIWQEEGYWGALVLTSLVVCTDFWRGVLWQGNASGGYAKAIDISPDSTHQMSSPEKAPDGNVSSLFIV